MNTLRYKEIHLWKYALQAKEIYGQGREKNKQLPIESDTGRQREMQLLGRKMRHY